MQKILPLTLCRRLVFGCTLAVSPSIFAQDTVKPLKALLITGGCCHDYAHQKDILKQGIEARANVTVDIIYVADDSTHPALPIYGNPDYAKGYDVVIHDECAADINDTNIIQDVLKPHQDGIPGVNLHCAMHCYRFGDFSKPLPADAPNAHWYEYLGLQSSGHGPQEPIAIHFTDTTSPITIGLADWTTIHEEHYNNIKVWDTAHALAHGTQVIKSPPANLNGQMISSSLGRTFTKARRASFRPPSAITTKRWPTPAILTSSPAAYSGPATNWMRMANPSPATRRNNLRVDLIARWMGHFFCLKTIGSAGFSAGTGCEHRDVQRRTIEFQFHNRVRRFERRLGYRHIQFAVPLAKPDFFAVEKRG